MKKILFKSGSTMIGGVEKIQTEYINFLLTKNEYEVKVIIENDNGENNLLEKNINTKVEYLKDFNYIKKIKDLRKNKEKNIFSKLYYNFELIKEKKYSNSKFLDIYKEYSPDIVIDFDSSLTKIIKELKKSKNIIWIHSSIKEWKKKRSKINRFVKKLYFYDRVICICKEMLEDLNDLSGFSLKNLDYLYNPLDFDKIRKLSKEEFKDSEKKLANEEFILHISRLDCIPKDFETLFEAFGIAKNRGYTGKLYLIGDGPDREKIENLRLSSKYKEDILLLGRKENPYNWLKKAKKIVLSSKYEGLPTILLEGLILGKEVISSNCKTGPKEILGNNRGKLFEIGDSLKLAEYILEKNDEKFEYNLEIFKNVSILKKFIYILEE